MPDGLCLKLNSSWSSFTSFMNKKSFGSCENKNQTFISYFTIFEDFCYVELMYTYINWMRQALFNLPKCPIFFSWNRREMTIFLPNTTLFMTKWWKSNDIILIDFLTHASSWVLNQRYDMKRVGFLLNLHVFWHELFTFYPPAAAVLYLTVWNEI